MSGDAASLRYRLAVPEPHTHLLHVDLRISGGPGTVHLVVPSWTPGSYLMREFPGQLEGLVAESEDGAPIAVERVDKNTWRIGPRTGDETVVRYRVHADELSVRTSHVDASHAFVSGTSAFAAVRELPDAPYHLEIDAPQGWEVVTELPRTPEGFEARDYDQLADSPLEIGSPDVVDFEVGGVPHRYAFWGEGNWHAERLVGDTRRIVETNRQLFGGELPYPSYTFIVHLLPGGRGGLEHGDSTALHADPDAFRGRAYESFLALVAHEHIHVWNGKRIRPEPLGRFDYTRENYTRNLWVVEGLTTYYTELSLLRAGLVDTKRFLDRLGGIIDRYLSQPGRFVQTLEESSFEAWIKLYRPTPHSANAQISYYVKGALVGLLLDLTIRSRTAGERDMDDVMRRLWSDWGARDRPFPEDSREGIERIIGEATGLDLSAEIERWLRTTEEIELAEALAGVGVRLTRPASSPAPTEQGEALRQIDRHLGVLIRHDDRGRPVVDRVRSGTPAWEAGINARDEVVSIDGWEPDAIRLACVLAAADERKRGFRVRRRGRDVDLEVHCPAGPIRGPWRLERARRPDAEQAARFDAWTGTVEAEGD